MYTSSMKPSTGKVLQLYVCAFGQSVLLLDDFNSHKSSKLFNALRDIGTGV